MTDEELFKLACGHLDALEPCSHEWWGTKAYVRFATSGTIKMERFISGEPTNHEGDVPFIRSLQAAGMLRIDVQPTSLDFYPTAITERVLAEMDRRDDPNAPTKWKYDGNPNMGLI